MKCSATTFLALFFSFCLLSPAGLATSLESKISFKGDWIQGGLMQGQAPPNSQIYFNDQKLMQAESGQFVFGFGRDELGPARIKIIHNDETFSREYSITKRDYNIQNIEGIDRKIMSPSEEDMKRAQDEAVLVTQARTLKRDALDFILGFEWPASGKITGVYGSQRIYNGVPGRPHYGLDIAGPEGTPVKAPAPGEVSLVYDDMFYSGGTLIIDHGMGISSTMIHLSKIHVKLGDKVVAGQVVGEIGSTGRSTGPHLDWRVNWFNTRLDPQLLID